MGIGNGSMKKADMGTEKTNSDLNPRKVALLLKIGSGGAEENGPAVSPETTKAELLRDRLANRLPTESLAMRQMLAHLGELYNALSSASGGSIEQWLLDRGSGIDVLQRIKEYGAALSRSSLSEVEQETANVIYYGAIASALVFHGRRITEFKLDDLSLAFDTLSNLSWLTPGLAGHFRLAMEFCQRQFRQQGERFGDE
jgi:hypothetical protein